MLYFRVCMILTFIVSRQTHHVVSLSLDTPMSKKFLLEQASILKSTLPSIPYSSKYKVPSPQSVLCYNKSKYYKLSQNSPSLRGFCNWLIPGKIMIGQYPGQVPESDGPTLTEVTQHLQNMINDVHVRTFLSLQSEIPSQEDYVSWNQYSEPGIVFLPNDEDREEFPNYFSHYAPLVRQIYNSTNKSNMNDKPSLDGSTFNTLAKINEIQFWHAPILDLNTPNSQSLKDLLSKIMQRMVDTTNSQSDSVIYIHCWGGRGRAGLVGACLLSLLYPHIDAETCLQWVQSGYDSREGAQHMPWGLRSSPQTSQQKKFVRDFVTEIRS